MTALEDARVLLVGVGGLGSPAARLLARSGVGHFTLADDDRVDIANLHRQILYSDGDVGRLKVEAAAERLRVEATSAGHRSPEVVLRPRRVLPDLAVSWIRGHDLVLEGTDNFASKFMVADACAIAGVPLVQAGAVRWTGWTMGEVRAGSCLRCVFEDVPRDRPETCARAGVVGPVVGVLGALQAGLGLRILHGDPAVGGLLIHYNGLTGELRRTRILRRRACPLCTGAITTMDTARYMPPETAA